MPGFDGRGPLGQGPMTGWGRGYCVRPYSTGIGRGFGIGRGRGLGRTYGYRRWARWAGPAVPQDLAEVEIDVLAEQINELKEQLNYMTEMLEQYKGVKKEKDSEGE